MYEDNYDGRWGGGGYRRYSPYYNTWGGRGGYGGGMLPYSWDGYGRALRADEPGDGLRNYRRWGGYGGMGGMYGGYGMGYGMGYRRPYYNR